MKKSICFSRLLTGGFLFGLLLLIGCLEKGTKIDIATELQLAVVPSSYQVEVGETVHFDIILLGEIVEADLYIDDQKVSEPKFKFSEEGVYEVQAKKEGVKSSEVLEVKVGDGKNKLSMKVSDTHIQVGESITFHAMDGLDTVEAAIFLNDSLLSGNEHQFDEKGTFKIHAQKEGYRNSDTLTIYVTENPKLYISASDMEIMKETEVIFTIYQKINGDIAEVDDASLYVDGVAINSEGYKYFFTTKGTFKVYAQKTGFENSDTLEIKVTEQLPKLSLSVPKKEVEVDEYVHLSPMYIQNGMGQPMKDAKVYVDGELVQVAMEGGFPFMWKSEATGTFKAYAEKDGYENSDTIEITVIEKVIQPQMIVTPSNTEVTEGTTVSFEVKVFVDNEPVTVPGAAFILDIDGQVVHTDTYTFEHSGVYTVVAKSRLAGGYLDSDPVMITVTADQYFANVILSGYEGEGSASKAMLWAGSASQAEILGNGTATDIYRFKGGFYLSGHEFNSSGDPIKAKYWDSFQDEVILENGISQANSIMVEPGDDGVVVGGSIGNDAVYWMWNQANTKGSGMVINDMIWDGDLGEFGVGNEINDGSSFAQIWAYGDRWGLHYDSRSYANAIAIDNEGDYFVAGAIEVNNIPTATLFGSQGSQLLSVPGAIYSMANDVVLQGNDLYIVGDYQDGSEWNYAVIWIDETLYKLNGNDEMGGANSVAVDTDGTIYVAGWTSETSFSNKIATYWEVDPSGNVTHKVTLTDGTKNAVATGIVMGD